MIISEVAEEWRVANVAVLLKKGCNERPENYRLVRDPEGSVRGASAFGLVYQV